MKRIGCVLFCLLLAASKAGAVGEVIRDGSIGPGGPMAVGSGIDSNGDFANYLIDAALGETEGNTLYHSFSTVRIDPGEIATFDGPPIIETVITRMTGPQVPQVAGMIRSTMPGAEFFFVSPVGIDILEGAQLDIPGSVHFSTAPILRFGGATPIDLPTGSLSRPTILSSAPPVAFGFGPSPAPISVARTAGSPLSVPSGEVLSFVGGNITFTGPGKVIESPASQVEIASTAGNQDVPLEQVGGHTQLDLSQLSPDALDGTVLLTTDGAIDVGGAPGSGQAAGSLIVRAGSFRIVGGQIQADHFSDVADGGEVDIGTSDSIDLDDFVIQARSGSARRGADVRLQSTQISMNGTTSSGVAIGSFAAGASGDFIAEAEDLSLTGRPILTTQTRSSTDGGTIRLVARDGSGTGQLLIQGDGVDPSGARLNLRLRSLHEGSGTGGAIELEADSLRLADSADVTSTTDLGSTGTGGAITVNASDVVVESGSFLATSTDTDAAGGALTVSGLDGAWSDAIRIQNFGGEPQPARISTNTTSSDPTAGDGGALSIRATQIDLIDGGQIFARTEGAGDAGILDIDGDVIDIAGILANPASAADPFRAGITSRVGDDGATGNAVLLDIDTRILDLSGGGQISTATFGEGDAGDLTIVATERVRVTGAGGDASVISARAVAGPTTAGGGDGGTLSITTDRLELDSGGQISVSTVGVGNPGEVGNAGDVIIEAGDVSISGASGFNGSGIFSRSDSQVVTDTGNSGDIRITATRDFVMSDGGSVEVSSTGDGDAGNIELDVDGSLRLTTGAQISSSSGDLSDGAAGSVLVTVDGDIDLESGSSISASTGAQSAGAGGFVEIRTAQDVRLSGASSISSSSLGSGDAGNIEIAANTLLAIENSVIETSASESSGGSIIVTTGELFELVDSRATTSVQGQADSSDAGNIVIQTPELVVIDRGVISAQAIEGSGGRIVIQSGSSFISGDSVISASSQRGPQGDLELTPPETALITELASLPAALADPSQLLRSGCETRTEREGSFTVKATPSIQAAPDEFLELEDETQTPHPNAPDCP